MKSALISMEWEEAEQLTSGKRSDHVAGLVLARGGSRGIPRKNVRTLAGLPLLAWVLRPMRDCKTLSSVWVSTDDDEIAQISVQYKAKVHCRKNASADTSSSIAAVQEFLLSHPEVTVILLVQCTSPCLTPEYLETACGMVLYQGFDSVFSVVRQHKLRWKEVYLGESTEALNFDPQNRPRRQDWHGELVESGHFYAAKVPLIHEGLLQGKRCGYVEMPKEMCIEIDSEYEWIMAEQLVKLYGYKQS